MPLTMSHTMDIAAPPERVFAAISSVDALHAWMPNLVSIEPLTEGNVRVGSQWRETRKLMGHQASEVFEVTALDAPRRLGLRVDGTKGTSGKGEFLFDYTLEPTPAGTLLKMDSVVNMPGGWFIKLLGKFFCGMMKKACV